MKYLSTAYINELVKCAKDIPESEIEEITNLLVDAYNNSRCVFIIGNGGSASTASHFRCDLVKGTVVKDKKRIKAMSLSDNTETITAIGNDISYEDIFAEQLKNFLSKGDLLIAISASGNSPNIIKAVTYAKTAGVVIVGLTGFGGGKLKQLSDKCIVINSYEYGVVEDLHLMLGHILSKNVKEYISQ